MKVMFVSQCTKNALVETRRIIDQFAERKGDCVWQTNITKQGLETVRKLLKSTARRNTAVACHLFKGRQQMELLWIVGNVRKFNFEGSVPTNITEKNILRLKDENDWNKGEAIALLVSLAGLFHDFGKANKLFQSKLRKKSGKMYEPFRHEWISLLLFKAFVGKLTDKEWLERLAQISFDDEKILLNNFPQEHDRRIINPLKDLPPLAMFIGWLILSHHRLPVLPKKEEARPRMNNIDIWISGKRFKATWNSYNCEDEWKNEIIDVGVFPYGTPVRSEKWRNRAKIIAKRALNHNQIFEPTNWFQDRFSMHMCRALLMLSDHFFSGEDSKQSDQKNSERAFANTVDGERGVLKQELDEHNIGVAKSAFLIAKMIPRLRDSLPSITRHKGVKKRSSDSRFGWQDKSYDLAQSLKQSSQSKGFFGVNLASTGCGKTLANARIMYGLSNEAEGCRFSVALGLRALTLQTGDALKQRLTLNSEDIAVVIGSSAFQKLHELNNADSKTQDISLSGSESLEDLFDGQEYVSYEGSLDDGRLSEWLRKNPKLHKFISAPVLVCTVDQLIPATEGCRGGKQIAPLLRLLTSDLVLDEPDDFDISDLPALCRLVNFAGVFGSRVLLSSATLPPSVVKALFEAYCSGRKNFNTACRRPETGSEVCCAWFDEFGVYKSDHADSESYICSHQEFIEKRIKSLEKKVVLRRAALLPVDMKSGGTDGLMHDVAESIRNSMYSLHDRHCQVHPITGKKISIGLVRMANIDPMIAMLRSFLSKNPKADYAIHFCVYHSRFPLLIRSKIEEILDTLLSRHKPDAIWKIDTIASSLSKHVASNHIFVVFATPVAEVGRDHDYDWAIIEPSSMRSIIQVAGRVQRHRQIPPADPNLMILQKNIRGLKGEEEAFIWPGFESKDYLLETKDLENLLHPYQYEQITAIPRLQASEQLNVSTSLVDLEHARLEDELLGTSGRELHASRWWKSDAHWCGELQHRMPFRKSDGQKDEFFFCLEEEGGKPELVNKENKPVGLSFDYPSHDDLASGIYPYVNCDVGDEIERLADKLDMNLKDVSIQFSRIQLRELSGANRWSYSPIFGFYLPVRQ